jgi:MFS transporter, UMF1 family
MADEVSNAIAPAAPAETLIADAAGTAQFLKEHEISAEGGRAASRLGQFAWALFEGARDPNVLFQIYIISPFFATVMIHDPVRGQALWGDIGAWSGYLTAILAPFFGAIADKGGRRKPWLVLFTAIMAITFAGPWIGVPDSTARLIFLVSALFALNNIVFEFSNIFHSAMLPSVAPHSRIGGLSGLASGLGSGSGLLLLIFFFLAFVAPGHIHASFVAAHPLFGVDQAAHEPERLAGPISAVWLVVLSIPLFLFTPDRANTGVKLRQAIVAGIRTVIATVKSLRHYRNVAHYIGARSIFNDGMTGVLTFTGIYAAGVFHLDALQMTIFGMELSVFATLGGFFGGWLDNRLGSKRALLISIGGTALSFALALTMAPDRLFWFFPVDIHAAPVLPIPFLNTWPQVCFTMLTDLTALCIVAGYANTRTMMARIAPIEKMTEFFGLMSLSGTATTFFAPLIVAWMTWWTHSQLGGMLGIVFLLVIGWLWMFKVKEERAVAV